MLPIVIAELRAATARGATGMTRALVHASKRASRKRSIAPREIPAGKFGMRGHAADD